MALRNTNAITLDRDSDPCFLVLAFVGLRVCMYVCIFVRVCVCVSVGECVNLGVYL
jgi:hypothetical protein